MQKIQDTKLALELELTSELQCEQNRRQYSWVDEAEGIAWESFSSAFPKHRLWLYTLLDVSADNGTGWQQLAFDFGLKTEDIQWCEKYCGTSGPTATMFSKLSPGGGVSLQHVLHHIISLGRHDLMTRIPWQECIVELKPRTIKLENSVGMEARQHSFRHVVEHTSAVRSTPLSAAPAHRSAKKRHRPYACSLLMIYAPDAEAFALAACRQLRAAVPASRDRIGVLLLSEQWHLLQQDPHNLLYKWFMQVDYVVPVLSAQLLSQMMCWSGGSSALHDDNEPLIALQHRYIFRLLLDQYVANACRNTRCRPICSQQDSATVSNSELVKNQGLLQVVTICKINQHVSGSSNNNKDIHMSTRNACKNSDRSCNDSSCNEVENVAAPESGAISNTLEVFAHLLLKSTPPSVQ